MTDGMTFVLSIRAPDGGLHALTLNLEGSPARTFWLPYFQQFLTVAKVTATVEGHEVVEGEIYVTETKAVVANP